MPQQDDGMTTPLGLPSPTAEEIARDRLRVLKEQEWARAMAEGEAARAKARDRAAEERARAVAEAAEHRARTLAAARQAAADAKGTILTPTGEARRAMIRSLLYALGGAFAGIGLIVLSALVYRADSTSTGNVVVAVVVGGVGCGAWIAGFLAAWYSWWVGVVGFVSDKIGDAVAKRMEQRAPPPPP